MTAPRGMPPGRAGRLWLLGRLRTAERAAELLDRKLTILRSDRRRYQLLAEQSGAAWEQRCADAETWLVRGVMLGGQRALRLAIPDALAEIRVAWASTMGLRYPFDASYTFAGSPSTAATPSNAALVEAVSAHRSALEAAVQHAVVQAALRTVTREIAVTARRRRAIADRWIPTLTEALRDIDLALEELEHSDAVRLRWAARRDRTATRPEAS